MTLLLGTDAGASAFGDEHEEHALLLERFRAARRRIFGGGTLSTTEQNALAAYENRPVDFTREVLGDRTWPGSRAVMEKLVERRLVAVQGPRKSTKSHTAAQLVLAMTCPTPTLTITTASVWEQVRTVIWSKVRDLHARSKRRLPGECHDTRLRIAPQWEAIGMSTDKPGRIQGFHSGLTIPDEDPDDPMAFDPIELIGAVEKMPSAVRLFLLLDEAAEIRAPIMETLFGSIIGDRAYTLWQFNPTFGPDSKHPAARAMRSGSQFFRIHMAGEEFDPALEPDPADLCFHGLPVPTQGQEWRDARAHDWGGKDSPLYRVHVLGLPAELELSRQFFPRGLLLSQAERAPGWPESSDIADRHITWDVAASEEGDANIAQLWIKGKLVAEDEWRTIDVYASCVRVVGLMVRWGTGGELVRDANVHFDATGVGRGCIGIFSSLGHAGVVPIYFGASPRGEWPLLCADMNFDNRKAELCWVLRRGMQEGIFCVPIEFALVWQQAQWHTWKEVPHAGGTAIAVAETKKDMKEEYGRSPDNFDAALLAVARAPAAFSLRVIGRGLD